MNQNYPDWIMRKLREAIAEDEDDTSKDEYIMQMSPVSAFKHLLEYEGIIGYDNDILSWIEGLFKIRLDPNDFTTISKADFVQGFGYFMSCNDQRNNVVGMRMDEREIVTITYDGGGTHTANVSADSFSATVRDIMKNYD